MKKALVIMGTVLSSVILMPFTASAFSYYLQEAPETFWGSGLTNAEQEPQLELQQAAILPVRGENVVNVVGAQGQVLEIVSLTGRRVESIRIESPAQRVELNLPKGCYILKVGKTARKVTVK